MYGPVENDGQIIANGGTLDIVDDVTGNGQFQINTSATLELEGAVAQGQTVNFSGTGPGTLVLDDPADFQGAITDIQSGDTIDLANVTPASAALALSASGAMLNVYLSSTETLPIEVSGALDEASPLLQSDGGGGTDLVFAQTGIVQLGVSFNNSSFIGFGTGLIIGPHSILTAAHVVWNYSLDTSATEIVVAPYGNGNATFQGNLQPLVESSPL